MHEDVLGCDAEDETARALHDEPFGAVLDVNRPPRGKSRWMSALSCEARAGPRVPPTRATERRCLTTLLLSTDDHLGLKGRPGAHADEDLTPADRAPCETVHAQVGMKVIEEGDDRVGCSVAAGGPLRRAMRSRVR